MDLYGVGDWRVQDRYLEEIVSTHGKGEIMILGRVSENVRKFCESKGVRIIE